MQEELAQRAPNLAWPCGRSQCPSVGTDIARDLGARCACAGVHVPCNVQAHSAELGARCGMAWLGRRR